MNEATLQAKESTMSPLVPTVFDGALMAVSAVALILALTAFILLILSPSVSGWRLLVWALIVFLVPIVGPTTWFVARHHARRDLSA
jgi:hypothetical protein